ncbi:hypothetical protein BKA69DRAFT_1125095 [Paraphysoderma sedebokerense]|nr:hypothetical protein BKA69DRAFT_1125095 [Paraphysoderma sedebokerense]
MSLHYIPRPLVQLLQLRHPVIRFKFGPLLVQTSRQKWTLSTSTDATLSNALSIALRTLQSKSKSSINSLPTSSTSSSSSSASSSSCSSSEPVYVALLSPRFSQNEYTRFPDLFEEYRCLMNLPRGKVLGGVVDSVTYNETESKIKSKSKSKVESKSESSGFKGKIESEGEGVSESVKSLAIAMFSPNREKGQEVTIFRGQNERVGGVSVGRWFNLDELRNRRNPVADIGEQENEFISVSRPKGGKVPVELEELRSKGKHVSSIFMLSDSTPNEILEPIDSNFPDTIKFGLISSQTPFVTGLPYTMYLNDSIVQDGMIGFAVSENKCGKEKETVQTDVSYDSLTPLSKSFEITGCKGNIILSLDDSNATKLLLDSINTKMTTITKEDEFYLSVSKKSDKIDTDHLPLSFSHSRNLLTVSKITAGDPSRGFLSIDYTGDLEVGMSVLFWKRDPQNPPPIRNETSKQNGSLLSVTVLDENHEMNGNDARDSKPNRGKDGGLELGSLGGFLVSVDSVGDKGKKKETKIVKVVGSYGFMTVP